MCERNEWIRVALLVLALIFLSWFWSLYQWLAISGREIYESPPVTEQQKAERRMDMKRWGVE